MTDTISNVKINDLLLDPENPRLPESIDRDQQSMLDHIAETTTIEELMEAIAENNFFQGEPIIVVPDQKNKGKYLVVEGNRRLTAVKLLNDPAICTSPGARMRAIAGEAKHKPVEIPVVIRNTRNEVLPYLGFRHITGVKQWEPLAKARYIEQLFALSDTKLQAKVRFSQMRLQVCCSVTDVRNDFCDGNLLRPNGNTSRSSSVRSNVTNSLAEYVLHFFTFKNCKGIG